MVGEIRDLETAEIAIKAEEDVPTNWQLLRQKCTGEVHYHLFQT